MTWRELLIGCLVACALTAATVLATRPSQPAIAPQPVPHVFD